MKKPVMIISIFFMSIILSSAIANAQSAETMTSRGMGAGMPGSNDSMMSGDSDNFGHEGDSEAFTHEGYSMHNNIILPEIAVGDGFSTSIMMLNIGSPEQMPWMADQDLITTGMMYFYAQDGTRLPVSINGNPPVSEIPFSLDPMMTADYHLTASGPVVSGWALIVSDDTFDWGFMDGHAMNRGHRIMASAFYTYTKESQVDSRVGVMPMIYEMGQFTMSMTPAYFQEEMATAVAIVNSGAETATITLHLKDENGETFGTNELLMPAGNQMAIYIHQLFEDIPEGFRGVMEVESDKEGIAMLGILDSQGTFTSLPTMHYGGFSMMPE